jgi:sugar O-acyltransferase (sialic acid O-acetyltransferase NeuD family)
VRTPLLILASGGLGREVAEAARAGDRWLPVGFLDDDERRWGSLVAGLPVLGGLGSHRDHPDAAVVLCAGKGAARLSMDRRLRAEGFEPGRYADVVHPQVSVPASAHLGPGVVLLAGTVLTADVRLGAHVVCMPRVVLTHDDEVEQGATLCAGVTLGGGVHIGAAAYLGMSSSVREGLRIGAGAVLGMGAVAVRDVPDGETWLGVPARPLRSGRPGLPGIGTSPD